MLVAAGFPAPEPRNLKYSKSDRESLLLQLRNEGKLLGRPPARSHIQNSWKQGRTASYGRFAEVFGSWNLALLAAGLSVAKNSRRIERPAARDRQALLQQIKTFTDELGRQPSAEDLNSEQAVGKIASMSAFVKEFGSWNAALLEAGGQPQRVSFDRGTLLSQVRHLAGELGRTPLRSDWVMAQQDRKVGAIGQLTNAFGSWNNALREAGYEPREGTKKRILDKETLKAQLQRVARKMGRAPSYKEARAMYKEWGLTSPSLIAKEFGTWNKALLAAGLVPVSAQRTVDSGRDVLIEQLSKLKAKLGRVPDRKDWREASRRGEVGPQSAIYRVFGTWRNAILEARLVD